MPVTRRFRRYSRYSRRRRAFSAARRYYRKRGAPIVNLSSRTRVCIKTQCGATIATAIPANGNHTETIGFSPFIGLTTGGATTQSNIMFYTSTLQTEMYRAYTKLYDEVKVDSFTVSAHITSPVGGVGTDIPGLTFISCWQRKLCKYDYQDLNGRFPAPLNIVNASSAQVTTIGNNQISAVTRSVRASDFLERSMFVDDAMQNDHAFFLAGQPVRGDILVAAHEGESNISWFHPAYFCCVYLTEPATKIIPVNIHFNLTAYYTFRGPKWSTTAYSKDAQDKKVQQLVTAGSTLVPVAEASTVKRVLEMTPEANPQPVKLTRLTPTDMLATPALVKEPLVGMGDVVVDPSKNVETPPVERESLGELSEQD